MEQLDPIVNAKNFDPAAVGKQSPAAGVLCSFVTSVYRASHASALAGGLGEAQSEHKKEGKHKKSSKKKSHRRD